ncbi:Acyltransferase 3 [uncultured Paludibacter sp.]|uniref:Acyltransferase 3 n=1 Tax=uncultured Paludibacter sp. TaxID=497635 RepID=A0A653ADV1_9BACT|nr:Acyltransferase 3 [uncultured Paludibacter sp.]
MNENKAHIAWLDTLRTIAILGVILIHICSPIVNMSFGKDFQYWWIGDFLMSATRYAVPVFLMLSGATLLSKEYKLGEFYKRRFFRVFVPLLFWMIVYWIFRYTSLPARMQPHGFENIVRWAINLFLTEGVSKHLWYVYMIVFIYLIIPFLGKFIRSVDRSIIVQLILIWLTLTIISNHHSMNPYRWDGNYLDKFYGYFLYCGYLILGYYIYTYVHVSENNRFIYIFLFMLTVIICAYFAYSRSIKTGRLNLNIYRYLSLTTILQSTCIFTIVKTVRFKKKFHLWFQKTVSDYSFGIYLVHIMILGIFFRHGIFWTMAHPLISVPVVFLLTLITSFIIIFVLRKIPYGKYVSG